jgi:hypothetical protein
MLPAERPAEAPPREEAKSDTPEPDDAKPAAPAQPPPTKKRR